MPEPTERTYEVQTGPGSFRITVPDGTRVTYGPVIGVGGKASGYGNVLRFWRGTRGTSEVQLALFEDVKSFRDLSLVVQIKAVRKFGSEEWWADDGSWTGPRADLVEKGWVSSDEIVSQPLEVMPDPGANVAPRLSRRFVVAPPILEKEEEEVKW